MGLTVFLCVMMAFSGLQGSLAIEASENLQVVFNIKNPITSQNQTFRQDFMTGAHRYHSDINAVHDFEYKDTSTDEVTMGCYGWMDERGKWYKYSYVADSRGRRDVRDITKPVDVYPIKDGQIVHDTRLFLDYLPRCIALTNRDDEDKYSSAPSIHVEVTHSSRNFTPQTNGSPGTLSTSGFPQIGGKISKQTVAIRKSVGTASTSSSTRYGQTPDLIKNPFVSSTSSFSTPLPFTSEFTNSKESSPKTPYEEISSGSTIYTPSRDPYQNQNEIVARTAKKYDKTAGSQAFPTTPTITGEPGRTSDDSSTTSFIPLVDRIVPLIPGGSGRTSGDSSTTSFIPLVDCKVPLIPGGSGRTSGDSSTTSFIPLVDRIVPLITGEPGRTSGDSSTTSFPSLVDRKIPFITGEAGRTSGDSSTTSFIPVVDRNIPFESGRTSGGSPIPINPTLPSIFPNKSDRTLSDTPTVDKNTLSSQNPSSPSDPIYTPTPTVRDEGSPLPTIEDSLKTPSEIVNPRSTSGSIIPKSINDFPNKLTPTTPHPNTFSIEYPFRTLDKITSDTSISSRTTQSPSITATNTGKSSSLNKPFPTTSSISFVNVNPTPPSVTGGAGKTSGELPTISFNKFENSNPTTPTTNLIPNEIIDKTSGEFLTGTINTIPSNTGESDGTSSHSHPGDFTADRNKLISYSQTPTTTSFRSALPTTKNPLNTPFEIVKPTTPTGSLIKSSTTTYTGYSQTSPPRKSPSESSSRQNPFITITTPVNDSSENTSYSAGNLVPTKQTPFSDLSVSTSDPGTDEQTSITSTTAIRDCIATKTSGILTYLPPPYAPTTKTYSKTKDDSGNYCECLCPPLPR